MELIWGEQTTSILLVASSTISITSHQTHSAESDECNAIYRVLIENTMSVTSILLLRPWLVTWKFLRCLQRTLPPCDSWHLIVTRVVSMYLCKGGRRRHFSYVGCCFRHPFHRIPTQTPGHFNDLLGLTPSDHALSLLRRPLLTSSRLILASRSLSPNWISLNLPCGS